MNMNASDLLSILKTFQNKTSKTSKLNTFMYKHNWTLQWTCLDGCSVCMYVCTIDKLHYSWRPYHAVNGQPTTTVA